MRSRVIVVAALALALLGARLQADDDWKLTGTAVRVKTVAFVDVNVYRIESHVKELPKTRSKAAMIELEAAKKLTWTMMRDVGHEKIQDALKDAFELNDWKDAAKVKTFLAAFKEELKEKTHVTIVWDPEKKETTVTVEAGKGAATVGGVDFMKAVWRLWFGKINQEKLGDELLAKLP